MKNTEENKLLGLKEFFREDVKIKQEMINLVPSSIDLQSEDARIEYTDKVDKFLKSFKLEINLILNKLGININDEIDLFFEKKTNQLANSLKTIEDIEKFYQDCISNIDIEFIEDVKKNNVGYSIENKVLQNQLHNVKTINELLHLLHSYVINNEEILKSLPEIETKKVFNPYSIGDFGIEISLYGDNNNNVSKELFDNFPSDNKAGMVHIIGLDNNVLIMARDLGHALTIDIDLSDSKPLVNYFIPKICNKNMVLKLPGIGKITDNGATGVFEIDNIENINEKIFDLMDKVPTDYDIVYDDKIVYEDEVEEDKNDRKFNEDDLKKLSSTRKISEVKTIISKLKDKIIKKDTIDKTR